MSVSKETAGRLDATWNALRAQLTSEDLCEKAVEALLGLTAEYATEATKQNRERRLSSVHADGEKTKQGSRVF
jgi:hypothetical protein